MVWAGNTGSRRREQVARERQLGDVIVEAGRGHQRPPQQSQQSRTGKGHQARHHGRVDEELEKCQVTHQDHHGSHSHQHAELFQQFPSALRPFQQQQGQEGYRGAPQKRCRVGRLRVVSRAQDDVNRIGEHFHPWHQGPVLICPRVGVADEGRGDPVSQRGSGGADEHELAAKLFCRHAPGNHIGEAVGNRTEGAGGADVVDGHAPAVQDLRGSRRRNRERRRRRFQLNGACAQQKRVLHIGDTFLGRAVGNPYGLHRHGTIGPAIVIRQADCHLSDDAVQFGLGVDMSYGGGGAFDRRERLQPARGTAVYRGIGELRGHYNDSGTADGARQVVVVFLCGGVREKNVKRDHLGVRGGQRVDGACDDLARPRETAEPDHTRLVNGHDGDVFGYRKRASGAHQPVPCITSDTGRLPVHQDAGRYRNQHDREAPGDLRGSCSCGQHSATFRILPCGEVVFNTLRA